MILEAAEALLLKCRLNFSYYGVSDYPIYYINGEFQSTF